MKSITASYATYKSLTSYVWPPPVCQYYRKCSIMGKQKWEKKQVMVSISHAIVFPMGTVSNVIISKGMESENPLGKLIEQRQGLLVIIHSQGIYRGNLHKRSPQGSMTPWT